MLIGIKDNETEEEYLKRVSKIMEKENKKYQEILRKLSQKENQKSGGFLWWR